MIYYDVLATKECNSIDRAICGIWTSRFSSRLRGEPAGPETNHRPVCSTIRGIRAAWCAGAVGGDSEVMWQWCVYVSVLSVVWMPVVFQNVSKHGRSLWTSFWKPYMMISIEELEVSHPKVCHAVRQAQGHSFWRFSMERCSYKKEPTGSVPLVAEKRHRRRVSSNVGVYLRAHCAAVAGSSRAGSKSKLRKELGDPSFIALYPTLPDSTLRLFDLLGLAVGERLKGQVVGHRVMGVIVGTSHEIWTPIEVPYFSPRTLRVTATKVRKCQWRTHRGADRFSIFCNFFCGYSFWAHSTGCFMHCDLFSHGPTGQRLCGRNLGLVWSMQTACSDMPVLNSPTSCNWLWKHQRSAKVRCLWSASMLWVWAVLVDHPSMWRKRNACRCTRMIRPLPAFPVWLKYHIWGCTML